MDDPLYVTLNPHVQRGLTWESVKWAWASTEAQNWHPLTWLSHMLDVQMFGMNAWSQHATNVLFHAANTALLFLLLERMTGARWRSLAAAALFGLHPLRVESVAWVSERKDVLSMFFWILATWAYVRYAELTRIPAPRDKAGKKRRAAVFFGVSLCLFAAGLLTKPMLVTLPFALLLLDYWPLQRWPRPGVKWLLLEKIPFLILAAASSAATYIVQKRGGAVTTGETLSLSARLANAVVSYARYLGKSVWPVNLSVMYLHPGHWPAETVVGAGLVLAVVSVLTVWQWRAMPFLAVGWFWFLGTLAPVIGIVQVGRQAMADRYSYVPSIGLWLAVVWGVAKLAEGSHRREKLAVAGAAAASAACIVLTVRQIGYWKDTRTLYAHSNAVTNGNWVMSACLANELERDGKADEAVALYEESLQVNPRRTEVRCKLGDLLLEQRHYEEALAQFRKATELDPGDIYSRERVGGVLQDMGRLDEAIVQLNQVIRDQPDYSDAYSNLGNCYGMKGRTDDAIRCFEQAVRLKPGSAQNHRELGVGLANKSRWDEAIAQFQRAIQLDPSDSQARQNLAAAIQQRAVAGNGSMPH